MSSTAVRRVMGIPLAIVVSLLAAPGYSGAAPRDHVLVAGGLLADQTLSPEQWVVRVESGAAITGTVTLIGYNRADAEVKVPFGYTWTWGPRESAFEYVDYGLAPGDFEVEVPIDLTAPLEAGNYYLIFGHRPAFTIDQVFSVTELQNGKPVWGDDNDYHDMDFETLSDAQAQGYIDDWVYLREGEYEVRDVAVTAIMVVVSLPTR